MRVLVCGLPITRLIEGCARGADHLAERYVQDNPSSTITLMHFPADWYTHGKAAGPIRNKQMLVEGKPDLVIAFPGGRGTANMVEQVRRAGVPLLIIKETP